ncbi:MAG: tyrosine-type recombinase/integrase [Maricaulaceae bacterium]|jgi:integrase
MIDEATARGLGMGANRILANTKTLLRRCVDRGLLGRSPAEGVRPPALERPEDRVLSDDELVQVWRAAEMYSYPYGAIVQLLILTGQYRDEVVRMRWTDLDRGRSTWMIPPERNKSGRPHPVALTAPAWKLIEKLEPMGPSSSLLKQIFKARNRSPLGAAQSANSMKWPASKISGCTICVELQPQGMARLGANPHVVERVLNHATSSTAPLARVYQRYEYEAEKKAALEAWAAHVGGLTT